MTPSSPIRPWLPWLVLVSCVGLTAVGTAAVAQSTRVRDRLRFDSAVQDVRAAIEARLGTYVALLRAGTALFAASEHVSRAEFRQFVGHLELPDRFPGIQGIGYARRIPPGGVAAVERELRAQGADGFTVWPLDAAGQARTAIVFLEPLDLRNRAALGFDMASDPTRRAAMDLAAEEGQAVASGRVTLVQERVDPANRQAGFLIYVPVYRGATTPGSPAERLDALAGHVYAPFRAGDLLSTVMQRDSRRVLSLRLYDGDTIADSNLLFTSDGGHGAAAAGGLEATASFSVARRRWTMVVAARPGFASTSPLLAPSLLVVGFAMSVLLFLLTRAEARARADAERGAVELRRSERELQAASRAKDEFLATLSHELRTPLNAILGWARMLRTGQLDPSRRDTALEVIERNARSQAQLIEDLLDVSRIITGKLRLDLSLIAVNAVVEQAVATVRPAAEAKGVSLVTHLDPRAGSIVAAADRVQQIAWNLLSNAIKFTPRGGRVEISTERRADALVLRVRDDGSGIAPEFLPHVFERFRQADSSTTRAHSGVGLGLAIVRHLVELHGGTIDAESQGSGRGATFTVVFPIGAAAEGERGSGPADAEGATLLSGLRLLVVDDDTDARTVVAETLRAKGAEVREVANVELAYAALAADPVDVVVSDLAMPGEDGYALVGRLRGSSDARLRQLPTIAMTAYRGVDGRDAVLARGFQALVPKPVDFEELVATVAALATSAPPSAR